MILMVPSSSDWFCGPFLSPPCWASDVLCSSWYLFFSAHCALLLLLLTHPPQEDFCCVSPHSPGVCTSPQWQAEIQEAITARDEHSLEPLSYHQLSGDPYKAPHNEAHIDVTKSLLFWAQSVELTQQCTTINHLGNVSPGATYWLCWLGELCWNVNTALTALVVLIVCFPF